MFDGTLERPDVAIAILSRDDGTPHRVHERGVPLCVEASAAEPSGLGEPWIVTQVLRNADLPWLPQMHFVVDPLHQLPPFGDVAARIAVPPVHVANVRGGVPA